MKETFIFIKGGALNYFRNTILKGNVIKFVLIISLLHLGSQTFAQQRKITGTVTDGSTGEALIGVSIVNEVSKQGTITDGSGKFSIEVTGSGQVLDLSYIGYLSEKVTVGDQSTYDIKLLPDIQKIEEIVVVGYGTTKKKDLTGASANLSAKDFNQGAITNPLQQIAGKAAGVNVTQIGSEPGGSPSVRIRGITSLIGGNDPLVVVDGVQGNMDLLKQIPTSEIASIDVLKDASATAIYGSRGAPGVILVTTKKSTAGIFTVEYNGTASVDVLANKIDVLSASEWRAQAKIWSVPVSADHGSDTDWYGLLTRNGSTQNHTLSFGGGTGQFNYRASGSAILQNGLVLKSDYQKYIGRISATQKAFDNKLTLTMNLNDVMEYNNGSPSSVGRAAFTSNLISNTYVSKPTDPVYNADGTFFTDANVFQYLNPYAVANTIVNQVQTNNLFGSFRADLELVKGLTAGWFGSWRKLDKYSGYYAPSSSTLTSAIENNGIANITTNLENERLMDISLAYKKESGKHSFNGIVVYEWQNVMYQGNFVQARGFMNDITTFNALQNGDNTKVVPGDMSSYKNDRTLVSFLGRINYGFANRYLLTVSLRRDGSSVLGENGKWSNFPSVSLAWKIKDESFMSDVSFISDLKIRGGYGVTGNQQGLSPQKSLQLVGASGTAYFNGGMITNYAVTQNANKDLKWETRNQTNIGIDFAFFNSRLSGTVDAFTATTKNLLFDYTVPQPPYPYSTVTANIGSLKNEGLEFSLNYQVVKHKVWSFTLAGNLSLLRNKVLDLSGDINGVPVITDYVSWGTNSYLIKGKPIGTYNILKHLGKDASYAETVVDANNDGSIDQGNQSPDRFMEGSALPTYTFAITPSFTYKNLDLSMVWRGSGGNKIYNGIKPTFSYFENLGKSNLFKSAVNTGLFTSQYSSDLWLEDGAYIRWDNLTIGYNVPVQHIKYISSIRLSVTGNNLALITNYSGLDPELSVDGAKNFGTDYGIYPRTRTFAVGLNIIFK